MRAPLISREPTQRKSAYLSRTIGLVLLAGLVLYIARIPHESTVLESSVAETGVARSVPLNENDVLPQPGGQLGYRDALTRVLHQMWTSMEFVKKVRSKIDANDDPYQKMALDNDDSSGCDQITNKGDCEELPRCVWNVPLRPGNPRCLSVTTEAGGALGIDRSNICSRDNYGNNFAVSYMESDYVCKVVKKKSFCNKAYDLYNRLLAGVCIPIIEDGLNENNPQAHFPNAEFWWDRNNAGASIVKNCKTFHKLMTTWNKADCERVDTSVEVRTLFLRRLLGIFAHVQSIGEALADTSNCLTADGPLQRCSLCRKVGEANGIRGARPCAGLFLNKPKQDGPNIAMEFPGFNVFDTGSGKARKGRGSDKRTSEKLGTRPITYGTPNNYNKPGNERVFRLQDFGVVNKNVGASRENDFNQRSNIHPRNGGSSIWTLQQDDGALFQMGPSSCTNLFDSDKRVDKAMIVQRQSMTRGADRRGNDVFIADEETKFGIDDSKQNYNRDALSANEKIAAILAKRWPAGDPTPTAPGAANEKRLRKATYAALTRNFMLAEGFRLSLLPYEAGPSGGLLEQAIVGSLMVNSNIGAPHSVLNDEETRALLAIGAACYVAAGFHTLAEAMMPIEFTNYMNTAAPPDDDNIQNYAGPADRQQLMRFVIKMGGANIRDPTVAGDSPVAYDDEPVDSDAGDPIDNIRDFLQQKAGQNPEWFDSAFTVPVNIVSRFREWFINLPSAILEPEDPMRNYKALKLMSSAGAQYCMEQAFANGGNSEHAEYRKSYPRWPGKWENNPPLENMFLAAYYEEAPARATQNAAADAADGRRPPDGDDQRRPPPGPPAVLPVPAGPVAPLVPARSDEMNARAAERADAAVRRMGGMAPPVPDVPAPGPVAPLVPARSDEMDAERADAAYRRANAPPVAPPVRDRTKNGRLVPLKKNMAAEDARAARLAPLPVMADEFVEVEVGDSN